MSEPAGPRVALVAVSKPGILCARRLAPRTQNSSLYVPTRFAGLLNGLANRVIPYPGGLRNQVGGLISGFDQLVFFLSVGAVVRLIAPHLRSKGQDPGVLVVDAAGRYVIPVLSGHVGGANAYAERLAGLLGATAVITTASDVTGSVPVDILGRELGWRMEETEADLTRVSACLVNGEPVALVQEVGTKDWWSATRPLPANLDLFSRIEDVDLDRYRALLWVTRRGIPETLRRRFARRLVVYRPAGGES